MKLFSLGGILTLSAVASAALAAPQGTSRLRRDVSELVDAAVMDYVPPVTEYLRGADASEVSTEQSSAVRTEDGYEYRTVRRLKLRHRNRRDVSHLSTRYLPPPSKNYLPPAVVPTPAAAPAAAPASDDTEEVVSAVEPKVAREYLPPFETEAPAAETETPAPVEPEEPQPDADADADVRVVDVPTAELRDDGYHYKQPEQQMAMELALKEAPKDYLPPLGDEAVAEGPANGESAVLTKDGYQYRAIRRYRF